jgi:hypothetical protein
MKIQPGDILIASNGERYRVLEQEGEAISLIRLNGYTLFACTAKFLETEFLICKSAA